MSISKKETGTGPQRGSGARRGGERLVGAVLMAETA